MLSWLIEKSRTTSAAAAALALILGAQSVAAQTDEGQRQAGEALAALRPYTGVYRLGGDHRLGIDRFIADNGDSAKPIP